MKPPWAALLALGAVAIAAGPARAQAPEDPVSIAEYRRLITERESEITRLEVRLRRLEVRRDSLLEQKRRVEPGSGQFETISNQVLENSRQITPVQRDLRILYRDVKSLKTGLFLRYNAEIARLAERTRQLERQGETPERNPELRRLVDALQQYIAERLRLQGEIEEVEQDLPLIELVYLPSDGPNELRWKEAIARDMVDKIDTRIAAIDERIEKEVQNKRMREEAERLRRSLDLWGDARSVQSGSELEQLLESRARGSGGIAVDDPLVDADERIRELNRRKLELLDRRAEYAEKAVLFANRLREFYR